MNEGTFPVSYVNRVLLATGMSFDELCHQQSVTHEIQKRQEIWQTYLDSVKKGDFRQPIIVLIGGSTCTGKSTLALDIAFRLGIRQVISSDTIREILRAIHPNNPVLKSPTYRIQSNSEVFDQTEFGSTFEQQSSLVWNHIIPIINRCVWGGEGIVIEGANLLPSVLMHNVPDWFDQVIYCVLIIDDANIHKQRFIPRSYSTHMRKLPSRYLSHFGGIRAANALFMDSARKYKIPVFDAGIDFTDLQYHVLELIFDKIAYWISSIESNQL